MRAISFLATLLLASSLAAQDVPRAISADPSPDPKHPARMQVLHVPSGGVQINGVAYVAAGAGVHPTFVLFHGLPGNEKNLDLAQAVRRAGWNAITVNYRGSWGSPGEYRFDNDLEDAAAVLTFLRDPANAPALGVDTTRIVLAGHSLGGWVTAHTAARDGRVMGAVLISAADIGKVGAMSKDDAIIFMKDNMESLAGGTAEIFAEDLLTNAGSRELARAAPGLAAIPMLVLTSSDGLAAHSDSLVAAVRRAGNSRVTTLRLDTDHSWSDRRIALQSTVLRWLQRLPERGRPR